MVITTMNRLKLNRVLAVVAIILTMLAAGHNFRLYSVHPLTNADLEDLNAPAQNTLETRSQQSEVPSHSPVIPSTTTAPAIDHQQQKRLTVTYGKLPLAFEVNRGQTDPQVKFLSRGNGYSLFLASTEAVLALQKPKVGRTKTLEPAFKKIGTPSSEIGSRNSDDQSVLRMKLIGSRNESRVVGIEELSGKSSYFRGKDPSRWHTQVTQYRKIKYESVYPGIDLIFYGNQRQLEFDFIVSPGADPGLIALAFEGAQKTILDEAGNLILETSSGRVQLKKPLIYQEIDGLKAEIVGEYNLEFPPASTNSADRYVSFQVAAYDRTKPLVIDPILSYATYLGGSGIDNGYSIAVDSLGNAYVTGVTNSLDFPTADAIQAAKEPFDDVFVTKLNADGSEIIYSTFLGGNGLDEGRAIAVDAGGNAYITGETSSSDFPTTPGSFREIASTSTEAFVTKISPDGSSLVYSTYLGGSSLDSGNAIAADSSGNVYVIGITYSIDFPTTEGAFDRTCGSDGNCSRIPISGSCFVLLPAPPDACTTPTADVFAVKLNSEGSNLVYSTYLGGSHNDFVMGVAVDSEENAYVTGGTDSHDFPLANPIQSTKTPRFIGDPCSTFDSCPDAFIAKLNPQGTALVFSTYLGGHGDDYGSAIALDTTGNAYVTGPARSADFLTTPGTFQPTPLGVNGSPSFITKIDRTGGLIYSSLLGFSATASGVAVDSSGNAYLTGTTSTDSFPLINPISGYSGGVDIFLTKVNSAGTDLIFSTLLGGNLDDFVEGIALSGAGDIYITGRTTSTNLATPNSFQSVFAGGSTDAFVARIRGRFVEVASPVGGEVWPVGSTQTVSWNSADVGGNVVVQISRDGASTWKKLFRSSVSAGSRSWKVSGPGTSQSKIRVCSVRTPQTCSVSANFAITPYYEIVSPNGGEVWPSGSSQIVQWNVVGDESNVRIEISRTGGSGWQTLFPTIPNTGSQSWTVTGPSTSAARIRVRRAGSSTPADTSDANFSIQ